MNNFITKFMDGLVHFNDNVLYYPVLIVMLLGSGIYFTLRTKAVQIRLFPEALRVVNEKPDTEDGVTGLQALLVTVGSKVGTGNIIGVSMAICLGGYGAVFWLWVTGLVGASLAFIESTLAQIYKRKDSQGGSYGGPAYYMEYGLNSKLMGTLFSISLIMTFGIGFNALASFNLQSSFQSYGWYNNSSPYIIGGVLAVLTLYILFGGGERIIKATDRIVPIMGVAYVLVAIVILLMNLSTLSTVLKLIFTHAMDFEAIFAGIATSALMHGIKRGLYSNEAGMGSAPNAAASAQTSHPAKQGLVQVVSTFIVTFAISTATALMTLSSGIEPTPAMAGAEYVNVAMEELVGPIGPVFVTIALVFFAFTTILGNLYYVDSNLVYLNKNKQPSSSFMTMYRVVASLVVFIGAIVQMEYVWALADFTMGIMALINIPAILILGKIALDTLSDYTKQKSTGMDPVFKAENIGLDTDQLDFWK